LAAGVKVVAGIARPPPNHNPNSNVTYYHQNLVVSSVAHLPHFHSVEWFLCVILLTKAVVSCAIIACYRQQFLHRGLKELHNYFKLGFMFNYCMQFWHAIRCNNCRLSNMLENIHEAKVLQPMTAFRGIT